MNQCSKKLRVYQSKFIRIYPSIFIVLLLGWSGHSYSELVPVSDSELGLATARANTISLPLMSELGFDLQSGGIEIDLDIQSSIDSVAWIDSDGLGEGGSQGSLILKGVHMGSSETPISAEQVRSSTPFLGSELAMIHGLVIESDPQKGSLITINQLGGTEGNGVDIIVNDIYFGKDLSSEGTRGLGLLVEDLTNFVSDGVLNRVNKTFGFNLSTIDDGMNTSKGNYYPIKVAIQPLPSENAVGSDGLGTLEEGLSEFSGALGVTGLTGASMRLDAEFLVYMDKIAVYRDGWEAGIEGLLIYNGVDTDNDGVEDLIAPVQLRDFKMQAVDHELFDGSHVKAINFPNIDVKMDIAMSNIYIGNPNTGSLGAIHIDDLHIHDTQLWIYPH